MIGHPNCKMWLPLNETTGTTATDLSGTGDGTLTGSPTRTTSGIIGGGVVLANTQYISLATTSRISINSYTMAAWVYLTAYNSASTNIVMADKGGYQFLSCKTTGIQLESYYNSSTVRTSNPINVSITNKWAFVAGVRDSANQTLTVYAYIDGVWYSSSATSGSATAYWSGADFEVGFYFTGYGFIGTIDNPMYFNTALPASDIKRIMLGKHPLTRS